MTLHLSVCIVPNGYIGADVDAHSLTPPSPLTHIPLIAIYVLCVCWISL